MGKPLEASKDSRARVAALVERLGYPTVNGPTVDAYVNHGRWVADCPICNGAELVAKGADMLCGSCGATLKVKFPRNRAKIDTLLEQRPTVNQNWRGEDEDVLLGENVSAGIF